MATFEQRSMSKCNIKALKASISHVTCNIQMENLGPEAQVINKFQSSIAKPHWNKPFRVVDIFCERDANPGPLEGKRRLIQSYSCPTTVTRVFLNGQSSDSFSFIFGLFKQTIQILQQINVKKCPSSIQCQDLNSQPSDYESPPLTSNRWFCSYFCAIENVRNILSEQLLGLPTSTIGSSYGNIWQRYL